MSHSLVYYGSDILKTESEDIKNIDSDVVDLVNEMFSIMKKSNGVGLAAPQIGINKNIITIDISHTEQKMKLALINPKIELVSDDGILFEEGCLSVPGIWAEVQRPSEIKVKAVDVKGDEVEFDADSFYARVLQHEIDHLRGILFIDRIDDYIRKEFTKELKKIKKMNKT
jgi:peptide deformylase